MKWFKHENTSDNPKIEILIESWGLEGYGVYFRILELISARIEPDNRKDWGYLPKEYTTTYLAKKLHIDEEKFIKIINDCVKLNLLQTIDERVCCPKILERCDDYTTRLIKQSSTNSEQTSDKVKQSSSRIEEEEKKNKKKIRKEESILADMPQVSSKKEISSKTYERLPEDKRTKLHRICYFLEDTLHTSIVNWGKQARALKMMEKAGYTDDQIRYTIKQMASDQFYDDKGFDLMTVGNSIAQYKAKAMKHFAHNGIANNSNHKAQAGKAVDFDV